MRRFALAVVLLTAISAAGAAVAQQPPAPAPTASPPGGAPISIECHVFHMFGKVVQNSIYFSFTNVGAKPETRIDFQVIDNGKVLETLTYTGTYAQGDVNQVHIPADPHLAPIDDALSCAPSYALFSDGTSWGTPVAMPALAPAIGATPAAPLYVECHTIVGLFGIMPGAMVFSYKNLGTQTATKIEFQVLDNGQFKETFSYTGTYLPNAVTQDHVIHDRNLLHIDNNLTCVPSYVLFADGTSWGVAATPPPPSN